MPKCSFVNAIKSLILSLVFILASSLPLWSQNTTWIGKVVGVSDGDTITVMHNGKGEKIRLYGIDCPEKGQAFGKRAKQFSSKMVFGRMVEAKPITTDKYGRTIAWIYIEGKCLNEELLKAGLAWHFKRYSSERYLAELETQARQEKAGLWRDPHSVPPWDFRHGETSIIHQGFTSDSQGIVYHGNIRSKKFHKPSCRSYNCKNCTAIFQSREEAIEAGYDPCGLCRP